MSPLTEEAKRRAGDLCKKCRAEILWATTPPKDGRPGKPIPIDPELVVGGNVALDVDEVGMLKARVVRAAPTVEAYVAHFATCPNANEFRKPPEGASHDDQRAAKLKALQMRLTFGMYEGQTLEEVDRSPKGHSYLQWLHRDGIRRPDLKQAVELVLGVES